MYVYVYPLLTSMYILCLMVGWCMMQEVCSSYLHPLNGKRARGGNGKEKENTTGKQHMNRDLLVVSTLVTRGQQSPPLPLIRSI